MIRAILLVVVLVIIGSAVLDCGNKALQLHKANLAEVEQIN